MGNIRPIHPDGYEYKTDPYKHQREIFMSSREAIAYALLMGMGTGKTKISIDTGAWNYGQGLIDCIVVLAPNGVHRNWIDREVPAHMPAWTNYRAATWASYMKKKEQAAVDRLFDPEFKGLRVIAFNIEAFKDSTTCKAAVLVRKLCNCFNVMMIVDESSKIKTPSAKRTKAIITLGKQAVLRRILTGTPVTNGPLDIFAQFKFLGEDILGFTNYYSFKHYFAEWEKETNYRTGHQYEVLTGYRNLKELQDIVDAHGVRVTKEECLDLPEKIYQTRYVEMTPAQRKLYNDIIQRSMMEFDNGEEMTVSNVLSKLLRLQQVLGGFVPREEFGEALPIENTNVRMNALMDVMEEADGKVIIWARFVPEIRMIAEMLKKEYGKKKVVCYYGEVKKEAREEAQILFQGVRPILDDDGQVIDKEPVPEDEQARFFVGQPHSGGYGLTLHAATTVVYYSNDFSLEARLQSEDRAHRIGQHHPVNYVDLECLGTVDSKIVQALQNKKNLAELITRDSVRVLLAKA